VTGAAPLELVVDATGVARLTLARPDTGNALDLAAAEALDEATATLAATRGLRAVLLSAAGPSFTVGGDLRFLAAHLEDLPAQVRALLGHYHAALPRLAALPVPVVAAAQGAAAGGGLGLLWVADVVLAADDLRIVTGFDKLGLSGDGGSSWFLPRLLGLRRARQLLLAGRSLSAAEALDWGLIDRVVPRADLQAESEAELARWAAGPTAAYGRMKRLLDPAVEEYSAHLDAECAAMVACAAEPDVREGVTAFLERRRPAFTGRGADHE
jgi:2-(1,2-epoxy-1,2-dihydrophenyl)acetyl-CoA isomerase